MEFEFKEPWERLEPGNDFHLELEREVCKGHKLFGVMAKAISKRVDRDDFLFELSDDTNRFAVVHLTWQKEDSIKWPTVEFYKTFDDWRNNRMNPDSVEWNDF